MEVIMVLKSRLLFVLLIGSAFSAAFAGNRSVTESLGRAFDNVGRFKDAVLRSIPTVPDNQRLTFAVTNERTLQQVETSLRNYEAQSIENLKKVFSAIPESKWQRCFEKINKMKKHMSENFFKNPQKDVKHDAMPLLEKTVKALESRGINPKSVSIKRISFGDDTGAGCSHIRMSKIFDPEASLGFSSVYLEKNKRFDTEEDLIINHEITHLLECHGVSDFYIKKLVRKYYRRIDLDNHPTLVDYMKSHELIAELLPCILNKDVAKAYTWYAHTNLQESFASGHASLIHPSLKELYPWLKCIIACYNAQDNGTTSMPVVAPVATANQALQNNNGTRRVLSHTVAAHKNGMVHSRHSLAQKRAQSVQQTSRNRAHQRMSKRIHSRRAIKRRR
jgi:hypothetical protein